MAIPAFTINGVIPPYLGSDGPGGNVADMSPYEVTVLDLVSTLGTSDNRKTILRKWLAHRAELRSIGFSRGFQWIDGSFVEDKEPGDIDVVGFFHRPINILTATALYAHMSAHSHLFRRTPVKQNFRMDFFSLDLNGSVENLIDLTRYYNGLFSHSRSGELWKGMLKVRLENVQDDADATTQLGPEPAAPVVTGGGAP